MSRLYLIEDHLMVREGLRSVLEAAKHVVVGEASDPTQALAELHRLAPDILLLDLALGARSGFEVLAEVRSRSLRSRAIVLTMSTQPRHVAEALRLGAAGYVLKTAPVIEVLNAIEAVMQGRRYLGSSVGELAGQALAEPHPGGDALDSLSPRERQIIMMVVRGLSSAAIGAQLHLAAKTIDTYRSRLMAKLGVGDVPSLVRLAIRAGLIDVNER
jgi:DNA-binding NarL/FixJ family response regulator